MAWTWLGPVGATLVLAAGAGIALAPSPAAGAGGLPGQMLDAAVVPPGAEQVATLPGSVFAQPAEEPACSPLTDKARYWVVPGDPADAAAFLKAHAPSWLPNDGTGWLGTTGGETISYEVMDTPRGKSFGAPAGLDFTIAAISGGMTGIRADAEVVPPGAVCTSAGAAAGPGTPVPRANAPASGRGWPSYGQRLGHTKRWATPTTESDVEAGPLLGWCLGPADHARVRSGERSDQSAVRGVVPFCVTVS
jgi:hypothetical protein